MEGSCELYGKCVALIGIVVGGVVGGRTVGVMACCVDCV